MQPAHSIDQDHEPQHHTARDGSEPHASCSWLTRSLQIEGDVVGPRIMQLAHIIVSDARNKDASILDMVQEEQYKDGSSTLISAHLFVSSQTSNSIQAIAELSIS